MKNRKLGKAVEMKKPLVSVILAFLNEEQYIGKAIESILNQTYHNIELIVIDDYSTDRSLEICERFKDPRIRIFAKTNEPRNLANSRNLGVQLSKGQYIVLQDADDYSAPKRIETQLNKALEYHGRCVVGCVVKQVEKDKEWFRIFPETNEEICKGFNRIYNRATMHATTILFPKRILESIPYRAQFKYAADWDQLLRVYESGEVTFYNCQEPLYTYYIRSKGVMWKLDWPDYNIWIRNCQLRRKKGLEEFKCIEDFFGYLNKHPLERIKWLGLKKLIELNLSIKQRK